jgi:hypothetical protein
MHWDANHYANHSREKRNLYGLKGYKLESLTRRKPPSSTYVTPKYVRVRGARCVSKPLCRAVTDTRVGEYYTTESTREHLHHGRRSSKICQRNGIHRSHRQGGGESNSSPTTTFAPQPSGPSTIQHQRRCQQQRRTHLHQHRHCASHRPLQDAPHARPSATTRTTHRSTGLGPPRDLECMTAKDRIADDSTMIFAREKHDRLSIEMDQRRAG